MDPESLVAAVEGELQWQAIRASGPGGQNVNKVATAVRLRWDIAASAIDEPIKRKLLGVVDSRLSKDGVLMILAREARTQARNRELAIQRLAEFVEEALAEDKPRVPTRVPAAQKRRRIQTKKRDGEIKRLRKPPSTD